VNSKTCDNMDIKLEKSYRNKSKEKNFEWWNWNKSILKKIICINF
jgi:hypothetical protein